jgi:hypothetical protein
MITGENTMIYITGDTHGMIDWEKLNTTEFPEQKSLTRDDYVIVVGDFGGVWDGDIRSCYNIIEGIWDHSYYLE